MYDVAMLVPYLSMRYPWIAMLIGAMLWIYDAAQRTSNKSMFIETFDIVFNSIRGKRLLLTGQIVQYRHDVLCQMDTQSKAILFHMSQLVKSQTQEKHMHYFQMVDIAHNSSSELRRQDIVIVPVQSRFFQIAPGIKGRVMKEHLDVGRGEAMFQRDVHEIKITILASSLALLNHFLDSTLTGYMNWKQGSITGQMCYTITCTKEDQQLIINTNPFSTAVTFDTLRFSPFAKNTEIVRRVVQEFESDEGRLLSKRLGKTHKLGMFFYGAPGSGKTSCIKAVAQMTGRHLICINMHKFIKFHPEQCVEMLQKVMFSPHIDDVHIPQSKRMYVFEEADTWSGIMTRAIIDHRSSQQSNNQSKKDDLTMSKAELLSEMLSCRDVTKDHSIVGSAILSGFLQIFDGLLECPESICIMTTNCPDKIDPALKRKGRFGDVSLEFSSD